MRRIESPSSILTHRHCPRKYYYHYIEKRPTKSNIHTIRGNIVHEVLDTFFIGLQLDEEHYLEQSVQHLRTLFDKEWEKKKNELLSVGLHPGEMHSFYVETLGMLSLWLEKFLFRLTSLKLPIQEAFSLLTPLREQAYTSEKHAVRGYVDCIEQHNGKTRVMDYKTSSKAEMTNEYKVQLSIYALLYAEKHGAVPNDVGIYFLKHADKFEQTISVTEELLKDAQFTIETHHLSTTSNQISDYPQHIGPLCKWSTGQCDFYELCFPRQKKLDNFLQNQQ